MPHCARCSPCADHGQWVAPSFWPGKRQPETGCILLCAYNDHTANPSLLVNDVLEPRVGDFSRQEPGALSFASHYLRRALITVRERSLAGFLTVHTHPFASNRVEFSLYDDANDPELMANLYDLQHRGKFGSIVLGRNAAAARLWNADGKQSSFEEMIIVGERIQSLPLNGFANARAPTPNAIFDRATAAFARGEAH